MLCRSAGFRSQYLERFTEHLSPEELVFCLSIAASMMCFVLSFHVQTVSSSHGSGQGDLGLSLLPSSENGISTHRDSRFFCTFSSLLLMPFLFLLIPSSESCTLTSIHLLVSY